MSKVGRNDPCPCGCGKKYKKCYGASNVITISVDRYNMELDKLHQDLIVFAIDKYEEAISNIAADYSNPYSNPNQSGKQAKSVRKGLFIR